MFEICTMTIREIVDNLGNNRWNLSPEEQRNNVWRKTECQRFAKTLLDGMPIGSIAIQPKGKVSFVYDGKQRLSTLLDLVVNQNIPFREQTYFDHLDPADKERIQNMLVAVEVMSEGLGTPKVSDHFVQRQNGIKASNGEKLNALTSSRVLKAAKQVLKKHTKTLQFVTGLTSNRFNDLEEIIRLGLCIYKGTFKREKLADLLVEANSNDKEREEAFDIVDQVLTALGEAFAYLNKGAKVKKHVFVSFFWLVYSHELYKKPSKSKSKKLGQAIQAVLNKIGDQTSDFYADWTSRRSGDSTADLVYRYRMVLSQYFAKKI